MICSQQSFGPGWRNGRRGGLKIRSLQGGVGSSPTLGTIPATICPATQKSPKVSVVMQDTNGGPVTLSIEYPQRLSRGHLLLKAFLGWLYAGIPHGIILTFYGILVAIISLISAVAILFTGRYPEWLFNIAHGYHCWSLRLNAYLSLMTDRYPPFSGRHEPDHPVLLYLDYPRSMSRGHLLLKFFLGWIYAGIPHGIALFLYGIAVSLVWVISFFVILFTGRYPEGMFRFVEAYFRWEMRLIVYLAFMSDRYPPFHGRA